MATRGGLANLATIRCQELDGFVDRLFGDKATIGLAERARRGLEKLSEMRTLMAAVVQMARDETEAATGQDLQRGGPAFSEEPALHTAETFLADMRNGKFVR